MKRLLKRVLPARVRTYLQRRVLGGEGIHADGHNFLLITLDSCRYDTYVETATPSFDRIGAPRKALAPANFTFPSHMAIFSGFTPGDPLVAESLVNPVAGKFWKVGQTHTRKGSRNLMVLDCKNVIDGYNKAGYATIGSGAMTWFDPREASSAPLTADFQQFCYPGNYYSLAKQIAYLERSIRLLADDQRFFAFLNVGETHLPYWHAEADWPRGENLCLPFDPQGTNDAAKCRARQSSSLAYVDGTIASLLEAISLEETHVLICGDHGDCWGEDGLWGHGITHEMVMTVPLVYRLAGGVEPS